MARGISLIETIGGAGRPDEQHDAGLTQAFPGLLHGKEGGCGKHNSHIADDPLIAELISDGNGDGHEGKGLVHDERAQQEPVVDGDGIAGVGLDGVGRLPDSIRGKTESGRVGIGQVGIELRWVAFGRVVEVGRSAISEPVREADLADMAAGGVDDAVRVAGGIPRVDSALQDSGHETDTEGAGQILAGSFPVGLCGIAGVQIVEVSMNDEAGGNGVAGGLDEREFGRDLGSLERGSQGELGPFDVGNEAMDKDPDGDREDHQAEEDGQDDEEGQLFSDGDPDCHRPLFIQLVNAAAVRWPSRAWYTSYLNPPLRRCVRVQCRRTGRQEEAPVVAWTPKEANGTRQKRKQN